jgi:hypothetical protein
MLPHDRCDNSNPTISPPEGHHHEEALTNAASLGAAYDAHQPFFEQSDTLAYFATANHVQRTASNVRPDPMQSSQATRSQEDVFGELISLAYLDPQHQQPRDGGADQLRYPWVMPPYDRPTSDYEK